MDHTKVECGDDGLATYIPRKAREQKLLQVPQSDLQLSTGADSKSEAALCARHKDKLNM
jgi:hypothetical protein